MENCKLFFTLSYVSLKKQFVPLPLRLTLSLMKKLLFLCAILASFVSVVNAEVRWFDGTHPVTYSVEGKSAPRTLHCP